MIAQFANKKTTICQFPSLISSANPEGGILTTAFSGVDKSLNDMHVVWSPTWAGRIAQWSLAGQIKVLPIDPSSAIKAGAKIAFKPFVACGEDNTQHTNRFYGLLE